MCGSGKKNSHIFDRKHDKTLDFRIGHDKLNTRNKKKRITHIRSEHRQQMDGATGVGD